MFPRTIVTVLMQEQFSPIMTGMQMFCYSVSENNKIKLLCMLRSTVNPFKTNGIFHKSTYKYSQNGPLYMLNGHKL